MLYCPNIVKRRSVEYFPSSCSIHSGPEPVYGIHELNAGNRIEFLLA